MTQIPSDDILEGLYKLRIRESEQLKTVLELYYLENHQKKAGLDYHRLKAMVKRSIEQEIPDKTFGARSGNYERNAVVKNQGTKIVYKEFLETVGNGSPTGSDLEETLAVFVTISISVQNNTAESFSEIFYAAECEKRIGNPKSQEKVSVVEVQVGKWLVCRARITLKELAPIHSVKMAFFQNACPTRPKWMQIWISALMRIARSMKGKVLIRTSSG